jgi:hypothetical protein
MVVSLMKLVSFWLDIALSRDWVYSKRFVYERVLDEIGNAIKKRGDGLENIDDLPSELVDQIIDDETIVIEYLLGTAFVLCQAYITDVISTVISLHKFASSQNVSLKVTTTQKQEILKFGHRGNEYSSAEMIDAFANYFKHRDEWGANWQKLPARTHKTVEIIQSAGAESGSTGNLRQGSIALGNPDFIETEIFLDKLEQWHLDLVDAYHTEFERVFIGESSNAH